MKRLKIYLGLFFIVLSICIYIFLIEPKDKIKLTPDMISKIKYLETNSVAEGTIKDYGQDAKNVFQKLISSETVVSKNSFLEKEAFRKLF